METPAQSHPYTQLSARVHAAARVGMNIRKVDLEYAVRVIVADGSDWPEFVRDLRVLRPDPDDEMCMDSVVWRTEFSWGAGSYQRDGDHIHPCIRPFRHTDFFGQLEVPCTSIVPRTK